MPILFQELNIYDPYNTYISRFLDDRFKYNRIHDKIQKLPANLLDFLFDLKIGEFIKEKIAASYNLNQDQAQETGIIVLELIVSDLYLGNIVAEIKNRLGLDDQKAKTIARLIVAELFSPILEELKKRHIEKFAKGQMVKQQNDDRTVDLRK